MITANTSLTGQSILLVENEPLISFDIQASLQECGANMILAPTLESAIVMAQHAEISAAIVDLTLINSARLSDALHGRGIPFMFYTGDTGFTHAWAPVMFKPSSMENVIITLAGIIIKGSNRKQVNVPVTSTLHLFKDS